MSRPTVKGDLAGGCLFLGDGCSWGGVACSLAGYLLPGGACPSHHQTATVADGVHPTGMHSCRKSFGGHLTFLHILMF